MSKSLFKPFSKVRDIQVMIEWAAKLDHHSDDAKVILLEYFHIKEEKALKKISKIINNFDLKKWSELIAKIADLNIESIFKKEDILHLVLEQSRKVQLHYNIAKEKQSDELFHKLRIEIKELRYILENFLPRQYKRRKQLIELQNLLGEYHDLYVFKKYLKNKKLSLSHEDMLHLHTKLNVLRAERIDAILNKKNI